MEKISKYLTYAEATKSDTATRLNIDNTPNAEQLANMKHVATEIFDKIREFIGGPLYASSFFRCFLLNNAVHGAKSSQHMNGEAIDADCDRYGVSDNKTIFYFVKDNLLFDQLIWEFGTTSQPEWIHFSLKRTGTNRKEVLRAIRQSDGSTKYIPFDL